MLEGHGGKDMKVRLTQAWTALALGAVVALGCAVSVQAQAPWEAPAAEKAKKNPVPSDAKTVDQGKKVAQINCASCHGPMGKGDGVASAGLSPKPADWTSKKVQVESDGEIFWKISTGRGAMPSWKHLPEAERWALVRYIRSLDGK
jgi:mono/diheme cytochrome c family protein